MAKRYATRTDVAGAHGAPGGVAPELNGIPDTTIAVWLEIAAEFIGIERFGQRASMAHALLTAHLLTALPGEDGEGGLEAGPLTAESNGPASRSFASAALSDEQLQLTGYGRAFVALRRVVRGRGSAVVGVSTARQYK